MTTEQLKATVEAAVGPIKAEMKWQRLVLFALLALVLGPKVPAAPAIAALAAADPSSAPHAFAVIRTVLHV